MNTKALRTNVGKKQQNPVLEANKEENSKLQLATKRVDFLPIHCWREEEMIPIPYYPPNTMEETQQKRLSSRNNENYNVRRTMHNDNAKVTMLSKARPDLGPKLALGKEEANAHRQQLISTTTHAETVARTHTLNTICTTRMFKYKKPENEASLGLKTTASENTTTQESQ